MYTSSVGSSESTFSIQWARSEFLHDYLVMVRVDGSPNGYLRYKSVYKLLFLFTHYVYKQDRLW